MKQSSPFSFPSSGLISRGLLALCCLAMNLAAHAATNTLQSVHAIAAGGNQVILRLTLTHDAPVPSVFTINDPARLAIDLPNTRSAVAKRYQKINEGPVRTVSTVAGNQRTRVVVELSNIVAYDIQRQGNDILVHLGGDAGSEQTPARISRATNSPSEAASNTPGNGGTRATTIRNIDFRRGEKGAGRIDIVLNGSNARIDVTRKSGKVIAQLSGISLPARLQKRLNVTDFATPVKTIDALSRDGGTRIVVTPNSGADYQQIAYQTGRNFYIELQPLTRTEQARQQQKPRFTGKKISLSFQNVNIRQVLQIIADVANVNMVVSDSVTGTMALRLQDVPWDQALDIILKAKGLGMQRTDNVISIAPLAEIAARKQAEQAARQATTNLAPLHSEIIQINYAKAADIAHLLRSSGGKHSLLSSRGQVTVDQRTNSLLVDDTQAKLDNIQRLIRRLDIPVRQVLIQSRIVVANRDFSRNLGVEFNANGSGSTSGTYSNTTTSQVKSGGFAVDLPVANPAGTLATSIITGHMNVGLILSALESENRGEVISSPRVITANGKQAEIKQGVEIPYLEAASSGAATVQFKDAVLSMTVTPQITPDERVIMGLHVTQDTQGDTIKVQGGGSVPSINTRSLTTQVLVDDGETVVLGGIYEQQDSNVTSRVPVLGKLPLIGALFRGSKRTHDKRELLLFVTPKILKEGLKIP